MCVVFFFLKQQKETQWQLKFKDLNLVPASLRTSEKTCYVMVIPRVGRVFVGFVT
jgi:hypothetical protein